MDNFYLLMLTVKNNELETYLLDSKVKKNLGDNLVALVMNVLNEFDHPMVEQLWNLMKMLVDDVYSNLNTTNQTIHRMDNLLF
jgi:hypothetical protein